MIMPNSSLAIQNRSRSALHFAAEAGHREMVAILLEHGADLRACSDGGWTALINAAERGHVETVDLLLQKSAAVNAQLTNGMTALHWAAFNGHTEVVERILSEAGVNLALRDSFDRTPMLCGAEKSHIQIARMLSPARNGSRLNPSAEMACRAFEATIVDFGMESKEGRQRVFKHSVYDLLYEWTNESGQPRVPTLVQNVKHRPDFRWIHLPSNNLDWLETLLSKHFIEKGARDIDDFKAFQKALRQEHRGPTTHSYFMRTSCQRLKIHQPQKMQAPVDEQKEESKATMTIPKIIEPSDAPSESVKSPELTAAPSDSKTAPPEAQTPSRRRKSNKNDGTPDQPKKKGPRDSQPASLGKKSKQSAPLSANQPRGRNDRTPVRGGQPAEGAQANIALFMPYLHYETDQRRVEMSEAIQRAKSLQIAEPIDRELVPDDYLIQGYLKANPPMHIRRTLDQYYYHGIDTTERDRDQVVYRYCRRHKIEKKIFMVDQLWLWTLGDDLIITAFPQRWNQQKTRSDPLNVLDGIIEDMNAKTRPPVKSIYDVAFLITSRCSGMFDRHRLEREEYQFLDMFESSIGRVTNRETKLFDRFDRASYAAAKWLKTHRKSRSNRRPFSFLSPNLELDHLGNDPGFQDILLDIGTETQLLTEIKDIRDELNILITILEHQRAVLSDLGEHLRDELRRKTDIAFEMTRRSRDQIKVIETHITDIKRMDSQALVIYSGLTGLLDLKQKHANAFETRFSRDQATLTARQGQTILVFTLTTILFLPMSFIAAFFAINIAEFPRAEDGSAALPLGYVTKYIIGIGLGISIPLIACALAVDDLSMLGRRTMWRLGSWLARSQEERKARDLAATPEQIDADSDDEIEESQIKPYRRFVEKFRRTRPSASGAVSTEFVNGTVERKSANYGDSVREFSPPLPNRSRSRETQGSWIRRPMDPPRMRWADDVERGRLANRPA